MAISADVERMLLARSGGFCGNPTCRADLFPEVPGGKVATLQELAHIIPQSDAGPRGDEAIPGSERDEYGNIVLLCPNCHTLVDKMKLSETYDADLLREWKAQQERRIRDSVNVPRLESREELFSRIRALLRENRAYWERYGPDSPAADHPLSEASDTWVRNIRLVMIPNNWQILALAQENEDHLAEDELRVLADFKVHADAFSRRHLEGEIDPHAPRFPVAMAELFETAADG